MKKLIALLLAALLMMSFACAEEIMTLAALMIAGMACAEIATVETTIPLSQPDSPVTITLTYTGTLDIEFSPYAPADQVRATVHSDDHADVVISIAPSDVYAGMSMSDLAEEEIQELQEIAGSQYENPTYATETSPEGNLYLFVSSNDEWDVDSLFTIYEGYFVELIQYHDDFTEQTEADDNFARSLLYGIAFSTNEPQAE